jgi:hypothetical protein
MYKGGCAFQPITIELGDIKIGAVEIQDQATSKRADVVTLAGQDRLAVAAAMAPGAAMGINANIQVQSVETDVALGPSGSFDGAPHDCLNYAGFGVSVYVARIADTQVNVAIEDSLDGVIWRGREVVELALDATHIVAMMNRVWSPTRRYMRARLANLTANALLSTEMITLLKPIP